MKNGAAMPMNPTPEEELEALAERYVRAVATDGLVRLLVPARCPVCEAFYSVLTEESTLVRQSGYAWCKHLRSHKHRALELLCVQLLRGLVVMSGGGWPARARAAGVRFERIQESDLVLTTLRNWITRDEADRLASSCMSKHEEFPVVNEKLTAQMLVCVRRVPVELCDFARSSVHLSGDRSGTWKQPIEDLREDWRPLWDAFARRIGRR